MKNLKKYVVEVAPIFAYEIMAKDEDTAIQVAKNRAKKELEGIVDGTSPFDPVHCDISWITSREVKK